MINPTEGNLGALFAEDEAILPDAAIDKLQHKGRFKLNAAGRTYLRQMIREWLYEMNRAPPTKEVIRQLKRNAKREQQKQKEIQGKVSTAAREAAVAIDEALQYFGPMHTSIDFKWMMADQPASFTLPQLCELLRKLAAVAEHNPTNATTQRSQIGRRPDGLNVLIKAFAVFFRRVGGKQPMGGVKPDERKRTITPFIKSTKVLIEALPGTRPKLTCENIANRVHDNALLADARKIRVGPTKGGKLAISRSKTSTK